MFKDMTKPLFVFDLANNHMGDVEHGLHIIREVRKATEGLDFHFAFKFQYRHLDTFIHPDFKGRDDIKYVKRFSETALTEADYAIMKQETERLGFITICTPFDEASVDLIEAHGFDILKIASCSFTDWPLLERVAKVDKPVIVSTAGATLEQIDAVVSFFEHRQKDLAVMHCVAEYPTPTKGLQLNQIDLLKARYPQIPVGYSTHESPDEISAVKIAVAKGAMIFEKHVGIKTDKFNLNAYSAQPEQIKKWVASAREAFEMCGVMGRRYPSSKTELSTLRALQRGVFAKRTIKPGQKINQEDIFLAIPTTQGQVTANDLSKYTHFYALSEIKAKAPVLFAEVKQVNVRETVYNIVQQVKSLLKKSGAVVPGKSDFEISHHYGLERFPEFGATIINLINREYCKKLIVMLPGQKHPEQYHRKKEETFHVLYGTVLLNLNGTSMKCSQGDIVTVERGVKHSFSSPDGAVIEELSSTHYTDDSFYTDPAILANKERKTRLTHWLD